MKSVEDKNNLVNLLNIKIKDTRQKVKDDHEDSLVEEIKLFNQYRTTAGTLQNIAGELLDYTRRRVGELATLQVTPFFAKINYIIEDNVKSIYISKFEFEKADVISWTSPIAALRYEDLGECEVSLPHNVTQKVKLIQKDTYTISNDKIIYYAEESIDEGAEIIYEDFFDQKTGEFGLSEIISKIEKEQFKIIQSDPNRPLIISGPAGSGKTTISLHKIAYLCQMGETSDKYSSGDMLMLVQDKSTKEYFASLLPKLGIINIKVNTYFEWSKDLLKLESINEIDLYNIDKDYYQLMLEKTKILRTYKIKLIKSNESAKVYLNKIYEESLSKESLLIYKKYCKLNYYDYIDMSIMLKMYIEDGAISFEDEYYKPLKSGKLQVKKRRTKIEYNAILVDEFQNYTSDQLGLITKCINSNKTIIYIGDENQKNAMKPELGSTSFYLRLSDRVTLSKVFRNTKNILEYIKSKGYDIEIADNARVGADVLELSFNNLNEISKSLNTFLLEFNNKNTLGILCDNKNIKEEIENNLKVLSKYKDTGAPDDYNNVKVMTKVESQGTEFHTVISIDHIATMNDSTDKSDIDNESIDNGSINNKSFESLNNIKIRNSNYVCYTRAVEQLVVYRI